MTDVYKPFAGLESRLEAALVDLYEYLQTIAETRSPTPDLLTGWDPSSELTGQSIVILAKDSTAERAGLGATGNHTITVVFSARTNATDNTGADHAALEMYMRSVLFAQNLKDMIAAYAVDLVVMAVMPTAFTRTTSGNWRISSQSVEFYVAGVMPT